MASQRRRQPTYLYLDGVGSRDLALALVTPEGVARRTVLRDGTRTEKFLPAVARFMNGSVPSGIIVAQGGGSFSQARVACAIVNALAYGWGIKVASVPSDFTLEQIAASLPKLRWQRVLLPKYSGPGVG